jgi:hypothetical protein
LKPRITYIGQSITPIDEDLDLSALPTPVTFTYTVTAEDESTQTYTVRVSLEPPNQSFSVIFGPIDDPDLISEIFDQSTGIVSLSLVPDPKYDAPYEWYLDGNKLSVSSTQSGLELPVDGLQPGNHEVTVIVTKKGVLPPYPTKYTNKVYFWVQE